MEFKVKPRTEVKIDVDGTVYSIKKPTEGQIEEFQEKLEQSPGQSIKALREFLVSLGLPLEIVRDRMEIEHIEELVEFLMPKKKS